MTNHVSEPDVAFRRAFLAVLLAAGLLSAVSAAFFDVRGVVSVLVGGVLGALNLAAIAFLARGFLDTDRSGLRLPWVVTALLKLAVLVAVAYTLVSGGLVELFPMAIGYAALPLGIVLGQGRVRAEEPPTVGEGS